MKHDPNILKIAIGSDLSGYRLKEEIRKYLDQLGIQVVDLSRVNDDVDYPDVAVKVSEHILSGECEFGILLHETGVGMSIAANKITGIKAIVCNGVEIAEIARKEQNCNILVMGSEIIGRDLALRIIDIWIGKS